MITIGLRTVGESHPSDSPCCDLPHYPSWSTIACSNQTRISSIVTEEQSNKRERRRGGCQWCRGSVAKHWWLTPKALGSTPGGTTFLSFSLPFQRFMDRNGPDYLLLDDHYQSLDCGGIPSIKLPILWFRSPSFMMYLAACAYKIMPFSIVSTQTR